MKDYEIKRSKEVLVVRKIRVRPMLTLLFFLLGLCLMLIAPVMNIFVYHYNVSVSTWVAVMFILIYSPVLIGFSIRMRKKTIIFDKHQNQVFMNGSVVCALTDVRKVKIGGYIALTGKDNLSNVRGLYLETIKGEAIEIERAVEFGSNIKELGAVIADFAQIKGYFS